jgi:hypothetical protein
MERLQYRRQRTRSAHQLLRQRRHVVEAVTLEQHLGVPVREPVAAVLGLHVPILDLEEARDGLLLKPLARVALVSARDGGELGSRHFAAISERSVEAETVADVDIQDLQHLNGALKDAFGQRVPALLLRRLVLHPVSPSSSLRTA